MRAIARSRDGGKTWDMLTGGLPDHIRANIEGMAMDIGTAAMRSSPEQPMEMFFTVMMKGDHWQTIIKGIGPVSKSHHYVNLSLDEQAAHH